MAAIAGIIADSTEAPFRALRLNTPLSRSLFGALVASGAILAIRPDVAFTPTGQPRPFELTSPGANSTLTPWWVFPLGVGVAVGMFT